MANVTKIKNGQKSFVTVLVQQNKLYWSKKNNFSIITQLIASVTKHTKNQPSYSDFSNAILGLGKLLQQSYQTNFSEDN